MTNIELVNILLNSKQYSTRERGDALEEYATQMINEYDDLEFHKTKGSGSVHGDGDIIGNLPIVFDGKVKGNCSSLSIPAAEMIKIQNQAAKMDKAGAIITALLSTKNSKSTAVPYVTLSLDDFLEIIQGLINETKDSETTS